MQNTSQNLQPQILKTELKKKIDAVHLLVLIPIHCLDVVAWRKFWPQYSAAVPVEKFRLFPCPPIWARVCLQHASSEPSLQRPCSFHFFYRNFDHHVNQSGLGCWRMSKLKKKGSSHPMVQTWPSWASWPQLPPQLTTDTWASPAEVSKAQTQPAKPSRGGQS